MSSLRDQRGQKSVGAPVVVPTQAEPQLDLPPAETCGDRHPTLDKRCTRPVGHHAHRNVGDAWYPDLEAIDAELAAKDAEIERLRTELDETTVRAEQARRIAHARGERYEQVRARLEEADEQAEADKAVLDARDVEIAQLRGLLDELKGRPDSWCSHQHITMKRFAEVVAEKNNAHAQREEATTHARKMIAEREQAEAERDKVQANLEAYTTDVLSVYAKKNAALERAEATIARVRQANAVMREWYSPYDFVTRCADHIDAALDPPEETQ